MKPIISRIRALLGCGGVVAILASPAGAGASGLFYHFNTEFSGGTAPNGPAPWIDTTFSNLSTGTVQVTIANSGLTGSEFVSGFYFNLNNGAGFNPTDLAFSFVSSTGSFSTPMITTGADSFMADGDGLYDVLLSFATSGGNQFGAGDSITYNITDSLVPNLSFTDFHFLSAPAGGSGPFYAAAHVQNTGANENKSGWVEPDPSLGGVVLVPVPEPSTGLILFLSVGLFGGGRFWLRRSRA